MDTQLDVACGGREGLRLGDGARRSTRGEIKGLERAPCIGGERPLIELAVHWLVVVVGAKGDAAKGGGRAEVEFNVDVVVGNLARGVRRVSRGRAATRGRGGQPPPADWHGDVGAAPGRAGVRRDLAGRWRVGLRERGGEAAKGVAE